MSIREANLSDSENLHILVMDAVQDRRNDDFDERGWELFCKHYEVNSIRERLQDNQYLTLCYTEDEKVLGVIAIYKSEKLDQLFIHPTARRKGVATSLWNAARKICEAGGAKPNYWLKSSPMAISLYESFGFQLAAEKENKIGITLYPMQFKRAD